MLGQLRNRESWCATGAEDRKRFEDTFATWLGLIIGVSAGVMIAAALLVPTLLGLLAVYIAFALALLGTLIVDSLRDRRQAAKSVEAPDTRQVSRAPQSGSCDHVNRGPA